METKVRPETPARILSFENRQGRDKAFVSYETHPAAPTVSEYQSFQQAYDFFNAELFAGRLPPVLVTLQRHHRSYGWVATKRFEGRAEKQAVIDGLVLKPRSFWPR